MSKWVWNCESCSRFKKALQSYLERSCLLRSPLPQENRARSEQWNKMAGYPANQGMKCLHFSGCRACFIKSYQSMSSFLQTPGHSMTSRGSGTDAVGIQVRQSEPHPQYLLPRDKTVRHLNLSAIIHLCSSCLPTLHAYCYLKCPEMVNCRLKTGLDHLLRC